MKKIKLNSAKLILKKDVIGSLSSDELKNVVGGEATGYGMCTNFTQEGYTCGGESNVNRCLTDMIGCPPPYPLPPTYNYCQPTLQCI